MGKVRCAFILCLALVITLCASAWAETNSNEAANAAMSSLKAGNARFVNARLAHPNQTLKRRNELASGQTPMAAVISCSDSRVPPEMIFDRGLGDIFVIRVAGNILNDVNIGSAEYAAEHTGVKLIVVLGHKKCGAVAAAVKGGDMPGHIKSITDAIAPAVEEAKKRAGSADNIAEQAAHINVENVVKQLRTSQPILAEMHKKGELEIVGAYYDLDTGSVEWLK